VSRNKTPIFSEKHLKALALIETGGLSLDSIAKECGWKPKTLYELYEGDVAHAGSVASLFKDAVKKIDEKQTHKIKEVTKKNKALANELINKLLVDLAERQANKNLNHDEKKLVATLMNCIAKASPKVEIGSVSYSYTQGYTPEQLVYEFRRLQTLAGSASNRSAIQSPSEGGAGEIPEPSGDGSEDAEEL
jgi:hypothetical protein